MITAALGFASLENTLFIIKTFSDGVDIIRCGYRQYEIYRSDFAAHRFIYHCGRFHGFFPKKNKKNLKRNTYIGLVVAGLLHFAFNYLIIESGGGNILKVLMPLWLIIIALIFIFEKVKSNIK